MCRRPIGIQYSIVAIVFVSREIRNDIVASVRTVERLYAASNLSSTLNHLDLRLTSTSAHHAYPINRLKNREELKCRLFVTRYTAETTKNGPS